MRNLIHRFLSGILCLAMITSLMSPTLAVDGQSAMEVVSFDVIEPTENGATLKMTRIPAGYGSEGWSDVYIDQVSYLVLPLSEDTGTPLDYDAVTVHEQRVDITAKNNMDFAYPIYYGMNGNTYECAIEGLKPGTEYVLYGAAAAYDAMGTLTEGTQECQRITFTTAGKAEEEPEAMEVVSFEVMEPTENGATLKMTRIPAGYGSEGWSDVYIDQVSYVVLPLSEDPETPLDYAAVTAHEARVDITAENTDFAYPIYMGYGSNTYECAIEGLEPGTEYVLYGAAAEYNAIGQLTEGTQECQRVTFTTAETASNSYKLTIDAAEHGTVTADKSEYDAGSSVMLTVTHEEGYVLTSLYYTVESSEEQFAIDTDTKTFTMPGGNVTVFAVFTPAAEENTVMKLMYTESGSPETQYFASYNDAIVALNALDNSCTDVTLTLLQDVDTGTTGIGEMAIVVQRSCTLNLNGKTLSGKPAANGDAIFGVTAETEDLSFTVTGGTISVSDGSYGGCLKVTANSTGTVTFLCENTNLKADWYALETDGNVDTTVRNSEITGTYQDKSAGIGVIEQTTITTDNNSLCALITSSAKIIDSTICSTADGSTSSLTNIGGGALYLNYNGANRNELAGAGIEKPQVQISDKSEITADAFHAMKVIYRDSSSDETYDIAVDLTDSKIASAQDSAVYIENGTNSSTGSLQLNFKAQTTVSGATYAIETTSANKRTKLSATVSDATYWLCGEGQTYFYPNSSFVTLPEGKRLSAVPLDSGYYTLVSAVDSPVSLTEWNALFAEAQAIHETGNDDYIYNTTAWDKFEDVYPIAKDFDEIKDGAVNQVEIDYFYNILSEALDGLNEVAEELEDGNYSAKVTMYFNNQIQEGSLSMSDAAFIEEVEVAVLGENTTLTFYVISPLPDWPQYDPSIGNFTAEIKGERYPSQQMSVKVKKTAKADSDLFGIVKGTEYDCYPYTLTIPKSALTQGYIDLEIYAYPMSGFELQNVDMVVHDFVPQESDPTLYLSKSQMSLLVEGSETATATLLAAEGYSLSVASSDEKVATAELEGNTLTVTAVGTGTATITVTASAAGAEPLTQTITVTVADAGAEAVDVAVTAEQNTVTATISGDALVTSGSNEVGVSGAITVDATTGNGSVTSAAVTIEDDTADVLADSGKVVTIQTDVGSVSLDAALMQQVAEQSGSVTLAVSETEIPQDITGSGNFSAAYDLKLTAENGGSVAFDSGKATISVPANGLTKGFAYYVSDNQLKERVELTVVGDSVVNWTTTHFSIWVLSATEFSVDGGSGNPGGNPGEDEYFLSDGNYYVDIDLYKENENTESMGNVAFKNNDRALVTVADGKITTVQIATNPVDVSGYHSAITSFKVDGTSVSVLDTGSLTTSFNDKVIQTGYTYVKRVEFTMPSAGQPEYEDEITYVYVTFYVPDTPMDEVVDATSGLRARIRFDWSTALATSDSSLVQDDSSATGTSSITGEEIVDIDLIDKDTGIRLTTDSERLSNEATLSVAKLTSGSDYDNAVKAMTGITDSWSLYSITALVDGTVTAPEGSVTISIPCTEDGLTVYRINAGGTKTVLKGEVKDGYYVLNTSSLGLFAIVGQMSDAPVAGFTDLTGHWAAEDIAFVVERGLFNGTSKTKFSPDVSMTRGMFVTVLARLAKADLTTQDNGGFTDVADTAYYAASVGWAVDNGIITGVGNGCFAPDRAITRQEMAVILVRYAQFAKLTLQDGGDVDFADDGKIASWAADAVETAAAAGLLTGTGNEQFSPESSATRAQVATLMARLIRNYSL